nr:MAG TPA: hypothetical protein [Caudoviricetes sp.]
MIVRRICSAGVISDMSYLYAMGEHYRSHSMEWPL